MDTGVTVLELYTRNGKAHRDAAEGPAVIQHDQVLQLDIVCYMLRGRLHRADGPASIMRYSTTGRLLRESYAWRGQWHREGGPAQIEYDDEGRIIEERYALYGMSHRDPKEGPAEIDRQFKDGVEFVTREAWCLFGKHYRDPSQGPHFIRRDRTTGAVLEIHYSEPNQPVPQDPRPRRRRIKATTAAP